MSIAESIKKIVGKQAVADIGKVISVNEDKETCEVEIVGMDDVVKNVRLSIAGKGELGLLIVPKEGTDVAVVWVNGVLPVVVAVAEPEKVMWKGEDFFEKMNKFIEDYKSHSHSIAPGANAGGYPLTATIQSVNANVEEFKK